jgi:hypothetical protein
LYGRQAEATGDGLQAVAGARGVGQTAAGVVERANLLADARAARDALAADLAPLKGKAPATVTAGYDVKTGQVAARACGGGQCAEGNVRDALGGGTRNLRLTEATRPRTGAQVPVCPACEATFGRGAFPRNTHFKSDE